MNQTDIRQFDRVRIKTLSYVNFGTVITTTIHGIEGWCLVKEDGAASNGCYFRSELEFIERPEPLQRTSDGIVVRQL